MSLGFEAAAAMMDGQVDHEYWMQRALALAAGAAGSGEVPVGAIVVAGGELLGEGCNRPIRDCDPSAHAEIVALRRAAGRAGNYRLPGARLYVTLEPCVMCAGAIIQARLDEVVYGAPDPRAGAAGSVFDVLNSTRLNHQVRLTAGLLANECGALLRDFFQERRE